MDWANIAQWAIGITGACVWCWMSRNEGKTVIRYGDRRW